MLHRFEQILRLQPFKSRISHSCAIQKGHLHFQIPLITTSHLRPYLKIYHLAPQVNPRINAERYVRRHPATETEILARNGIGLNKYFI